MEINIDTSELDELQKKLDQLNEGVEVSSDDLMTDSFIGENTQFNRWQDMLDAGGVKTGEDIESPEFSAFIAQNSRFEDWEEMVNEASAEYISKQLTS